jgi:hypothetical protein
MSLPAILAALEERFGAVTGDQDEANTVATYADGFMDCLRWILEKPVRDSEQLQYITQDLMDSPMESNPAGLTAKGERMYEHIKAGYGDTPRAAEIASRTVLARAKQVPGLKKRSPKR